MNKQLSKFIKRVANFGKVHELKFLQKQEHFFSGGNLFSKISCNKENFIIFTIDINRSKIDSFFKSEFCKDMSKVSLVEYFNQSNYERDAKNGVLFFEIKDFDLTNLRSGVQ